MSPSVVNVGIRTVVAMQPHLMCKITAFPVQLDTGSSDLWVSGVNTSNIETSGQPDNTLFVEMDYGSGSASGNAFFATLEVGGLTVPNQGTSQSALSHKCYYLLFLLCSVRNSY